MTKITRDSLKPYSRKVVTVAFNGIKFSGRVMKINENSLVLEYHHWLKTPEDGLLREVWIKIDSIQSITEGNHAPVYVEGSRAHYNHVR